VANTRLELLVAHLHRELLGDGLQQIQEDIGLHALLTLAVRIRRSNVQDHEKPRGEIAR
jgi:hypothetical protein